MRAAFPAFAAVLVLAVTGCQTFRSHRVIDECSEFPGTPALMHKAHIAVVTWSKEGAPDIHTSHYCTIPVLYAVDVIKAPLGTTKGIVKLGADGQLTESHGEVDQKIPELVKAIGDAVPSIAGAQRAAAANTFAPELDPEALGLDGYHVSNMSFTEL